MKLVCESLFEFQRGENPSEILELGRLKKTEDWLKNFIFKGSYIINNDWTIDLKKDFIVTNVMPRFEEFPEFIQFNICYGDFIIRDRGLISLVGCPKIVHGDFLVDKNKIQILKGCPEEVGKDFYIGNNTNSFTIDEIKKKCNIGGKIKV